MFGLGGGNGKNGKHPRKNKTDDKFTLNTSLTTLQNLLGRPNGALASDVPGTPVRQGSRMGKLPSILIGRNPLQEKVDSRRNAIRNAPVLQKQGSCATTIYAGGKYVYVPQLPEPPPRVLVPLSIFIPTGKGLGISCHGIDASLPGIKVQSVSEGPSMGQINPEDRIIKVGDRYIDRISIPLALEVFTRYLRSKPNPIEILITRAVKPKKKKVSKNKIKRRILPPKGHTNLYSISESMEHGSSEDLLRFSVIDHSHTESVMDSPRPLTSRTQTPFQLSRKQDKLSPVTIDKENNEENIQRVMEAIEWVDKKVTQKAQAKHIDLENISLIAPVKDVSRVATPESDDQNDPVALTVYMGKNRQSLGMRMVGAKSTDGNDKGIFVGGQLQRAAGSEENSPQLLRVGDQIIKMNNTTLVGIPNATAATIIKHALRGPEEVSLTILRYSVDGTKPDDPLPSLPHDESICEQDLLRNKPWGGSRPPPEYDVSQA